MALCIFSDLNKNEYFIVENRRRQGWDAYLPGQGIMVTHVTFSRSQWYNNKHNNDKIQLLTFLPADGKYSKYSESTDTWPYGAKDSLTDNSNPATILNMTRSGEITGNAGFLGKPITEMVINRDGTASFWFVKQVSKPVISVSSPDKDFGVVKVNNKASAFLRVQALSLQDAITVTVQDNNDGTLKQLKALDTPVAEGMIKVYYLGTDELTESDLQVNRPTEHASVKPATVIPTSAWSLHGKSFASPYYMTFTANTAGYYAVEYVNTASPVSYAYEVIKVEQATTPSNQNP
jgi:hypothetical protein